jgi:Glycosyltransferase
MPFSFTEGKDKTAKWYTQIKPKLVLDVGPGGGTYSQLIQDKLGAKWVGVEIWEPYVQEYNLKNLYDDVIISDIRDFDYNIGSIDLIIAGDIIEHLPYEDAIKVINKFKASCKNFIISIPIAPLPQRELYGNINETHHYQWTFSEMRDLLSDGLVDAIKGDNLGVFWWNAEQKNNDEIIWIKIDVEMAERQVLEGMSNLLFSNRKITLIIEDKKNELTDLLVGIYGFNLVTTERRFGNKILTKNQPFEYEPEPFTIHLISLPHTETTKDYSWCAFTSLIINMATMMTHEGHKVILYAGENNEAECFEHINCSGKPKSSNFFVPPWTYEYFKPMNDKIIEEMKKRIHNGDIILQSTSLQSVVADAFPHNTSMEYAIGYGGCKSACRVFPCEAWRHEIYGRDAAARGEDIHTVMGYSSDCVIPHMFNVDQFPEGKGDGGYLLFVGRLGGMKGEQVAVETSKRTGIPLKLIGPGTPPNYGEYLGVKQPKERAELMGGAIAVIAPSMFPEPFNMVAVEAQLCGTPMITTDWGGFTETIENGVSGYRCSTLGEFAQAVLDCKKLDRTKIRERAISKYSFEAVGPQYTKFFHRLEEIMPK